MNTVTPKEARPWEKDKGLFRFIDEPLADIIGYQYLTCLPESTHQNH